MIFNKFFYSDNSRKKQHLLKLELQITHLFENYHIAWNNFADELGPELFIPKLSRSVKCEPIYSCLQEMDHAMTTLCDIISNISNSPSLSELIKGESKYTLDKKNILSPWFVCLFGEFFVGVPTIYFSSRVFSYAIKSTFFSKNTSNTICTGTSVVITVVLFILVDAIFSCMEESINAKEFDERIAKLHIISKQLTDLMVTATDKLTSLTQSLKDGIILLDTDHMLIIDKSSNYAKVITLHETN
ncbi:MAG: hypothetical protein ACRCSG_03880 [Cellulosilyticaceae bacterium]